MSKKLELTVRAFRPETNSWLTLLAPEDLVTEMMIKSQSEPDVDPQEIAAQALAEWIGKEFNYSFVPVEFFVTRQRPTSKGG